MLDETLWVTTPDAPLAHDEKGNANNALIITAGVSELEADELVWTL